MAVNFFWDYCCAPEIMYSLDFSGGTPRLFSLEYHKTCTIGSEKIDG
jgi:hypothetical protein